MVAGPRRRHLGASIAALWLLAPGQAVRAADDTDGVVVAGVAPGLAAETAGLQPGDRLLRWSQADAPGGPIASPFDVQELEAERGPRGPVRLHGRRGEAPLELELFPDDWGLEVRPRLPPELAAIDAEARRAAGTDAAVQHWRALQAGLDASAPRETRAWAWVELARAQRARRQPDPMAQSLREAIALAQAAADQPLQAHLWGVLGALQQDLERFEEAAEAVRTALSLRPPGDSPSLARAALRERATTIAYLRGKGMEDTRDPLREALALQERLAPRSLARVRTIVALAPVIDAEADAQAQLQHALMLTKGLAPEGLLQAKTLQLLATVNSEPPRKLELAREALRIRERRAPESLEVVASLRQIGMMLNQVGQPGPAEEHLLRALALQETLAPDAQQHGRLLNNLAILAKDRGDLAVSEAFFRRYLALTERVQPDSIWLAIGFLNFGQLLSDRRQPDEAEGYLARAWTIVQREAPRSDVAAYILTTRGGVARERGDAAARGYLDGALDILRTTDPKNVLVPQILQDIADMVRDRGQLDEAQALYEQALAAAVQRAPASVFTANAHESLGALASRRDRLADAETHHRAALELRREVVPDSIGEAESSHSLGLVLRRSGRKDDALDLLRRAVAALEAQGRRLGGSAETRAGFRAHYLEFYRDLESLLLEMGRREEAFETVERSRARALIALLASRDLRFERDASLDLEAARRSADADYDRLLRRLGTPKAPLPEATRASLRAELERARRRQDDVRAQIRAAAPRLAALRDPESLDLAGVRSTLGPGTLLLTYSIGPDTARVYAVGPGPEEFAVHDLRASPTEIRQAVEAFRARIEQSRGALGRRALDEQARRLGTLLLGSVSEPLGRARRLLVVPDGVLHLAPLSALRIGSRYLVEALPVQVIASVTLSQELARRAEGPSSQPEVVGFGDPAYPRAPGGPVGAGAPSLRNSVLERLNLEPLPAGRRELQALASLAPGSARIWLGAEATEERVKAVGRSARVVHFATHGFMDDSFPLESGLVLSIPARLDERTDNGLLQAWEVFEQVRLDADLVTLSACQTGLGREVVGEGLLGLIWAFQYAGARSVLATLWSVNDEATAELMRGFYRHLRAGRSKDTALQQAQLDLLRRPATSAPFFWAPFQLSGDGR